MIRVPWSRLRGIGNSAAAKATILMPLVGYLVLFNGEFVAWLQLHQTVGDVVTSGATEAALGWRLLCLYYGLMLVAIATIVYTVRCPWICKRYADAIECARDTDEIHSSASAFSSLIRELRQIVSSSRRAPDRVLEAANGELRLIGSKDQDEGAWDSIGANERSSRVQRLLAAKYNLEDYSRPLARIAVAVLYAIGLLLLAIPSGHLFFKVTQHSLGMFVAN
jgi:hypothetical protein